MFSPPNTPSQKWVWRSLFVAAAAAVACNMRCDAMGCDGASSVGRDGLHFSPMSWALPIFSEFSHYPKQSPHFVRTFLASLFFVIVSSPNTPFSIITFIAFRLRPELCVASTGFTSLLWKVDVGAIITTIRQHIEHTFPGYKLHIIIIIKSSRNNKLITCQDYSFVNNV